VPRNKEGARFFFEKNISFLLRPTLADEAREKRNVLRCVEGCAKTIKLHLVVIFFFKKK
jgi:hypothetical protein